MVLRKIGTNKEKYFLLRISGLRTLLAFRIPVIKRDNVVREG